MFISQDRLKSTNNIYYTCIFDKIMLFYEGISVL